MSSIARTLSEIRKACQDLTDEQLAAINRVHVAEAKRLMKEAAGFQRWADSARKEIRRRKSANASREAGSA